MKQSLGLTICLLLAALSSAKADTIYSYTYKGNLLFCGNCSPAQAGYISGDFTLAAPLPANFTGEEEVIPLTYSFTNNSSLYPFTASNTQTGNTIQFLVYATDAENVITAWSFGVIVPSDTAAIGTQNGNHLLPSDDWTGDNNLASNYNNPGSWQVSPLPSPEPSTFLLLGTSLVAIIGIVRSGRTYRVHRGTRSDVLP
jgi:hypothetical protein